MDSRGPDGRRRDVGKVAAEDEATREALGRLRNRAGALTALTTLAAGTGAAFHMTAGFCIWLPGLLGVAASPRGGTASPSLCGSWRRTGT
jgi:hypothetical protein